jgi:outer membrane protein assembly factor BamB
LTAITAGSGAAASEDTIILPGTRAFPESVTASKDGTLYIGSLADGGITRAFHGSKVAEPWIKPAAFGTASILGVLADDASQTLWVCSNDMSAQGVTVTGASPGSVLKGFDLKTGEGKISAEFPNKPALCNDIAVSDDGSVYVTNTARPEVLRLNPKTRRLEVWFTDPALQPPPGESGLDGIAFGSDGNLYVDRYTPADLFRINVRDGKPAGFTKLQTSRPLVLTDALRRVGPNDFLLVEGGGRLDSLVISGERADVQTLRDGLIVPTGVAPVGHIAWVSEGQLSILFDPTKKGTQPQLPFRLYAVPF